MNSFMSRRILVTKLCRTTVTKITDIWSDSGKGSPMGVDVHVPIDGQLFRVCQPSRIMKKLQ